MGVDYCIVCEFMVIKCAFSLLVIVGNYRQTPDIRHFTSNLFGNLKLRSVNFGEHIIWSFPNYYQVATHYDKSIIPP